MKRFINRVEKSLIRFAVLSLLIMVLVQGLMTADPIRFYLSWGERMEGQTIQLPVSVSQEESSSAVEQIKSPQAKLSISVDKFATLPKTKILINGEEKYNLSEKQVTVDINAGDTIEIDSRSYDFPIDYKIVNTSSNLAYPNQGQIFTGNKTIVMVGEVIVK